MRVVKLVMLEFVKMSVEPTIGALLNKMDRELYLIPGMDHAVASILNHDVPKIGKLFAIDSYTRAASI